MASEMEEMERRMAAMADDYASQAAANRRKTMDNRRKSVSRLDCTILRM
jgi:hypothetical protein